MAQLASPTASTEALSLADMGSFWIPRTYLVPSSPRAFTLASPSASNTLEALFYQSSQQKGLLLNQRHPHHPRLGQHPLLHPCSAPRSSSLCLPHLQSIINAPTGQQPPCSRQHALPWGCSPQASSALLTPRQPQPHDKGQLLLRCLQSSRRA